MSKAQGGRPALSAACLALACEDELCAPRELVVLHAAVAVEVPAFDEAVGGHVDALLGGEADAVLDLAQVDESVAVALHLPEEVGALA